METLNAAIYRDSYGDIVSQRAILEVPAGWHVAVETMLQRIAALPATIRTVLVIMAIGSDETGLLEVVLGADEDAMPPGGYDQVRALIKDARDLCAWSCVNDGEHGWMAHSKSGPRVLCPACQSAEGLEVKCHAV